ncbi:MAG: CotH kinase family protein [Lachnospiraceae bacterium]|nr:CotH kinase family protein [Lachnospiraceae bacterium]
MKRLPQFLLLFLFGCFLCSCSQKDNTTDQPVINPASLGDIPVLSIETVSDDAGVMKFVTAPVAPHVAESIASWTPYYQMPPAPYYEACTVTLTDTDNSVLLDHADAQVKVRGNWTTSYEKKPLRIKFSEAQNLLGLNDGATFKNWLLLAEYKDASMLRNKTAFSVARELLSEDDLYVSDASFVEVMINGQYWGVYLLAEQQQINKDRVDITEPEKGYTGTDIGYFLEFDAYFMNESELQQFYVDYADNAALVPFDGNDGSGRTMKCLSDPEYGRKKEVGFTIKSDIYSEEQRDFIASYVNNVYNIMYAAAYEGDAYQFTDDYSSIRKTDVMTPREAVERVVDIPSLADIYILNELLCDADVYWSSFYMSVDFGPEGNKKLTFEAPWDFDSAMGNKNRCLDGTGFYAANIVPDVDGGPSAGGKYETINPWLAVLIYEDWFQSLVKEKWTKAYDSGVFERAAAMITEDTDRCSEAFLRNYDKWNNIINNGPFVNELSPKAAACKTQKEAADFLLTWFQSRVDFLNGQWHN